MEKRKNGTTLTEEIARQIQEGKIKRQRKMEVQYVGRGGGQICFGFSDMSQVDWFKNQIKGYSNLGKVARECLTLPSGELNYQKLYDSIGFQDQKFLMGLRAAELDMTSLELRQFIEARFDSLYRDLDRECSIPIVKTDYHLWCDSFKLEADSKYLVKWNKKD